MWCYYIGRQTVRSHGLEEITSNPLYSTVSVHDAVLGIKESKVKIKCDTSILVSVHIAKVPGAYAG